MHKRGIAAHVVGMLLVALGFGVAVAGASAEPAPPPDGPSPVPCKSVGGGHYNCSFYPAGNGISAGAPVQSSSGSRVGYLNQGTNWVTCEQQGGVMHSGSSYNDWWAYTEANDGHWGWVNAVYASGGDNNGPFESVPSCGSAHGSPPGTTTTTPPASPTEVPCTSTGSGHYNCSFYPAGNGISGGTPVQGAKGGRVGYLNQGTNWIICQAQGATVHRGPYYNDWWAYTKANDGKHGWVNAVYANGGDNDGQFGNVPGCGTAYGPPPSSGTITPPTHHPTRRTFHHMVALGDSYSSGEGTEPTTPHTCQQTRYAYGHLVARHLHAHLKFVACSGYTTSQMLRSPQRGQPPEVNALSHATDLVTLTGGGDDAGFADVLTNCVPSVAFGARKSGPWCGNAVRDKTRLIRHKLPGYLDTLYSTIRNRAPHAKVVVIGYPYLFSSWCKAFKSLRDLIPAENLLDSTIERTARRHGFTYVDTRKGFAGHSSCNLSDVWINNLWPGWRAAYYLTHKREYLNVYLKTLAFHPNVSGHKEFAKLIEGAL